MFDDHRKPTDAIAEYVAAYRSNAAVRDEHLIGCGAVRSLEDKIRERYGFEFVVLAPSGTAGLFVTALALELNGAEFITSVYGYGATLAAWLTLGNKPVFVDIDRMTLNIDPALIPGMVSGKAKALLSTDLFGVPSDTEAIREIADRHGLWYVADGCQAFGATMNGKAASHMADVAAVSFTSGKDLAFGEGGAVLTNDAGIYRRLLWFGQHPYRQKRELGISVFNPFAVNARIHPLAAVWGDAVFENTLERIRRKQDLYLEAVSLLNDRGAIEPIDLETGRLRPSFFCLAVEPRVPVSHLIELLWTSGFAAKKFELPATCFHRSEILRGMLGPGIESGSAYPVAEKVSDRYVALSIGRKRGGDS